MSRLTATHLLGYNRFVNLVADESPCAGAEAVKMPDSGEHDLFGVQFPMITSKDLAFAFQAWLRWLGVNPNLAEARRVTTLVRSFARTFEVEDLEAMGRAVPSGELFEGVRDVVRLELARRETLGK